LRCSVNITILIFGAHSLFAIIKYNVTDLGTLGGDNSYAYDVNNYGHVVGFTRYPTAAFLWEDGVMNDLGNLGGVYTNPSPKAINNLGQVVGNCSTQLGDTGKPFIWENGAITELVNLHLADGINISGQIVGGSLVWEEGMVTSLGSLGGADTRGFDINDLGQVVGFSYTAEGKQHAFLWENGVMTDLETLGESGITRAYAINNLSQVVGASSYHAFIWENGTITDLGTLGGNLLSGDEARDINKAGQIVGSSQTTSGPHAFFWENGVMTDLNDLIGTDTGFILNRAYGINDLGQIVGVGRVDLDGDSTYDADHAFLLTPISETITVTSPDGGEELFAGTVHEITWSSKERIECGTDYRNRFSNPAERRIIH